MKELTGLHRGDAAIVGGGLTGLMLASSLAQAGMRVILLDTGENQMPPCSWLATALCVPAYQRIEAAHGLETARVYAAALMGHLSDLLTAAQPYIQRSAAYIYACTEEELPLLHAEQELLQRLGIHAALAPDAGGCPFPVECSLTVPNQVVIDMAQWKSALVRNIRRQGGQLYSCAAVSSLHSTKVCTTHGCAEAPVIVFAGGMPPFPQRLPYLLERRLTVMRELHSPFPLHSSQIPVQEARLSLSPTHDGALARWDAGRCGARRQQERLRAFEKALASHLPDWQHGPTHYLYEICSADGLPVIGNLPGSRHLIATGIGRAGILGAMHAAASLTRRIFGQLLPEDQLYVPDRPLPRWLMQRERKHHRTLTLQSLLRRSAPACSQCGCRMRYCTVLAHWECPSCGSVFDMLGQVVCGPAMQPAHVSVRQRPDL